MDNHLASTDKADDAAAAFVSQRLIVGIAPAKAARGARIVEQQPASFPILGLRDAGGAEIPRIAREEFLTYPTARTEMIGIVLVFSNSSGSAIDLENPCHVIPFYLAALWKSRERSVSPLVIRRISALGCYPLVNIIMAATMTTKAATAQTCQGGGQGIQKIRRFNCSRLVLP